MCVCVDFFFLLNKGHGGRTPPFGDKTNRNPFLDLLLTSL